MISAPPDLRSDQLWLPTQGRAIPRPWFIPSPEALAAQRRIEAETFFLVRIAGNDGIGEALRCDPRKGGCGGKHKYITLRCVEQPFSGLTRGIYAYWRAVRDNGLEKSLSPAQRMRYDAMTNTVVGGLPDLGSSHPDLARRLTTGLGSNDAMLGAMALGVLDPIPPTYARKLADRINERGIQPRFVLEVA